jgi:cyclic pyranopterin phosphate synthase
MVDVGEKPIAARYALATALIRMKPSALEALRSGATPKGDVLAAARAAGLLAAKRTSELIPACHPVTLTSVTVDLELLDRGVQVSVRAEAHDRTGVEMEALVAASVAALTLYDMMKGLDRAMVIEQVQLEAKGGGRSGSWVRGARSGDARGA